MSRANQEAIDETKSELEMTPMIDVTFLLLIFFLCATQFKSFDRKLESNLPANSGPSQVLPPDERLPTEVTLRAASTDGMEVEILLGNIAVPSFAELQTRIAARHHSKELKEGLPLTITAADPLVWQHVVSALDAARGAGVVEINFGVGRENPSVRLAPR